jgi:hypothetical protein
MGQKGSANAAHVAPTLGTALPQTDRACPQAPHFFHIRSWTVHILFTPADTRWGMADFLAVIGSVLFVVLALLFVKGLEHI